MRKRNVGTSYDRDKYIADLLQKTGLDFTPVVASGSNWRYGKNDIVSDDTLIEVKSTGKLSKFTFRFYDWFQLRKHAHHQGKKNILFIFDFAHPVVNTPAGEVQVPEEILVAMSLEDYVQLRKAAQKINFLKR